VSLVSKPLLMTILLIIIVIASESAVAFNASNLIYGGGGSDNVWSAHPMANGGFAVSVTTLSFNVSTYKPWKMGALWALFLDKTGSVNRSVVIDLGTPAAYYDSELVGTTLYSVGTTKDYMGVIAAVDESLGVKYVKNISILGHDLIPTVVELYGETGSLIVLIWDRNQTSIVLASIDLNGTVEWAYNIDFGLSYYYTIPFSLAIVGDKALVAGYYPAFALLFNLTSKTVEWARVFYKSSLYDLYIYNVTVTGNEWFASGIVYSAGYDGLIIKGDISTGSVIGALKVYTSNEDYLFGSHIKGDSIYFVGYVDQGGSRRNDTLIFALNTTTLEPKFIYQSALPVNDWSYNVVEDSEGKLFIVGGLAPTGDDNVWITQFSDETGDLVGCNYPSSTTPSIAALSVTASNVTVTVSNVTNSSSTGDVPYTTIAPSVFGIHYCPYEIGGQLVSDEAIDSAGYAAAGASLLALAALLLGRKALS